MTILEDEWKSFFEVIACLTMMKSGTDFVRHLQSLPR